MQHNLSVFKNAVTKEPYAQCATVSALVKRICSEKYQPQTHTLRTLRETTAKDYKKTAFVAVTWSGTFAPSRSKANLQTHSGLICIDLDKLQPERLTTLREQLQADEFTHVLFVSPSGTGLKVVLRIDYQQPADHERFFKQISDYYRDCYGVTDAELDASGKNVDRLCFLPHDPDCFYNPDSSVMPLAEEYTAAQVIEETPQPAPETTIRPNTGGTDYRKLARCADLIRNAIDGGKHTALCKAATLAGGFIASGIVRQDDAVRVLEDEVRAKPNVADFKAAQRTIAAQIEFGKTRPINDEGEPETHNKKKDTATESEHWPQPLPLLTSLRAVLPMEPDMIPEPLRAWLTDVAFRVKCPLDFVAATAVVMLSSLIGTRLTIKPKNRDDWTVVPNLWGGIIGGPSTMKTPSMSEVLKPLNRLDIAARATFEEELREYEQQQVEYEAQKKAHAAQAQDKHRGKKIDSPVVNYPDAVKKPQQRRYMVNDATVEKLAELLKETPQGLLQIRDELTGLLASWDKSGHEQDRAFHLEAWNGSGSMTIDRIGRGTTHVNLICESLFGGIQPAKLLPYLQAATGYENDGFVQRLQVVVYPDKAHWEYGDEYPDKAARDRAFTLIQSVAGADFKTIGYDASKYETLPHTRFDADAQEVFKKWLIELQTQVLPNESGLLEEHFNKYRSLMPSLALIFHVVNVTDTPAPADESQKQLVSSDAAAMAVRWCAYLMSHARRIYGLLDTAPLEAAKDLLRHIRHGDLTDGFKVRDVQRQRWKGLTSSEQIDAALSELLTRHYLREVLPARSIGGGRPEASSYAINPEIISNT